ncbi:hypothetical protein RchiOBHm_Chr4g0433471 [Rosa chinensis]|uniref:Uncharacterized protein n=1 Tax=Rosa chinensis TaxID=74649 RepID=A0A2P6R1A5_ROSCH|nr:hypothetical protein RchiOBHm_Chr4g0433471 [Rosa chinensis]
MVRSRVCFFPPHRETESEGSKRKKKRFSSKQVNYGRREEILPAVCSYAESNPIKARFLPGFLIYSYK